VAKALCLPVVNLLSGLCPSVVHDNALYKLTFYLLTYLSFRPLHLFPVTQYVRT